MSLEDIVQLTIVVSAATFTRPGFGTPLALVSKLPAGFGAANVRTFAKLSELTDLGFTSADAGYKLAQKIVSQNPRAARFKLARRTAPSQSLELTCLEATEGKQYAAEFGINGGATTPVTYTVLAAATTTTVATAIAALITAVTGIAASSSAAKITITPESAGDLVNIKAWAEKGKQHFTLFDATTDPGVEDDLDDIWEEDADWYGLLLDSNSEAEVKAAAAWAEANKRLLAYSTADTGAADPAVTTDVASDLKTSAYERTFGLFNQSELLDFRAAAWMSLGFAHDPGKITWAMKTLATIAADKLTTGQRGAIEAKNLNHYENVSGKNVTRYGTVASGEYIDVIHGLDWFAAEMRLQIFAAIAGLPKVPYTLAGFGVIEAAGKSVMRAAVRQGLFADDENLFFRMPALADIDAITRAARLVPNIEFGARLAGAIHKTKAEGLITN